MDVTLICWMGRISICRVVKAPGFSYVSYFGVVSMCLTRWGSAKTRYLWAVWMRIMVAGISHHTMVAFRLLFLDLIRMLSLLKRYTSVMARSSALQRVPLDVKDDTVKG